MNELKVFENPAFGQVRTTVIDGEPWFVGKDVAVALGYKDTSDALKKHVEQEDKLTRRFADSGQNREMYIINESGLYSLILSSKLPTAKEFKRWVTAEVLPAIRKHGAYMTPDTIERVISNPDFGIQLLTALKEEQDKRQALQQKVAVQQQQIDEMKSKASYYDVVLNCKDLVSMSVIAKDYGWSATKLNRKLHELGVQYKQGQTWLLYQKYAQQGYTSTKVQTFNGSDGTVHSKTHTYWTQKGRLFIYDLLKDVGILPAIEREEAA